jgi:hypothetical protein
MFAPCSACFSYIASLDRAPFDARGRAPYSGPMTRAFIALSAVLLCGLAAAAPAQRAGGGRGLWIGPVPACAGTVTAVEVTAAEYGDGLSVNMTFRPAWREALRHETARLVGQAMPVRLDGRTLMRPIVREPIAGGVIALSAGTARQAERIRAAALRPCRRRR